MFFLLTQVRQCRAQMPLYKPEPFYQPPSLDLGDVNVGVNVDSLSVSPNAAPSTNIPAISYEEPSYAPAYLHQNSPGRPMNYMPPSGYIPTTIQPMRRRPAPIFVGRPVKPREYHTLLSGHDIYSPAPGCPLFARSRQTILHGTMKEHDTSSSPTADPTHRHLAL